MRQSLRLLLSLFTLLASLSAYGVIDQQRAFQLRGYVNPTQNADLPYRQALLGVNADLRQYDSDELDHHLRLMEQAQIVWVRQFFYWDEIEPQAQRFDWSAYDALVSAVGASPQLRLVAVLMHSPAWAQSVLTSDYPSTPPASPDSFAYFARALAERYGDQIEVYQIWDEPNLAEAWGQQDPRPAEYAALLQAAYSAIKSTDDSAQVLAAALAPTTERTGRNWSDFNYLEELYRLGANAYFDAVAAKPYGFSTSPEDRQVSLDILNFSRIVALRELMLQHGEGRKALWASHWGWNSLPPSWTGSPSIWGQVTPEQQVIFTQQALQRAQREWAWLGGMILHHWQPSVPLDDPQWGFALIQADGTPSALYDQLLQQNSRNLAQDGLYHPANPFARYSGVWTFGELGADIGWLETSDSQLEFRFYGRELALLLRQGDYIAFLYPRLNNQMPSALPQDASGNAYIFLQSDTLETKVSLVPLATDLSLGDHLLQAIADKGWDRWALVGYAVSTGDLAQPYEQSLSVIRLSIVLSAVVSLYTFWHSTILRYILSSLSHIWTRFSFFHQLMLSGLTSLALMLGLFFTWQEALPAVLRKDATQLGIALIISAGLMAFEPAFIISLVALFILFLMILQRLELGLMLSLFWAPFFLFPVELYRFAFPMAELLLLLTALAWGLRGIYHWALQRQSLDTSMRAWRSLHTQLLPLDYAVLAFLILGTFALFFSERRAFALSEWRTLIFEPTLFYAMLRTIATQHTLNILLGILIASGTLVAILGLGMYASGTAIITTSEGSLRLASVYGSPNNVALLLARCLPVALSALLYLSPRWRPVLLISLGIMGLALVLTQSVGGLVLGLPFGLAGVLLFIYQRRALMPLLGLAIIALVSISLLASVSPRFANLFDPTRETNFIRLRVWESGINLIAEHPLLGIGLDQFLYEYRDAYLLPDAIYDKDLSHPHNILLDVWLRLGLAGVIWLALVQFYFWQGILRLRNTAYFAWHIAAITGTMLAILVHGLIDNSLFVPDLAFIFMLLLATLALNQRHASSPLIPSQTHGKLANT